MNEKTSNPVAALLARKIRAQMNAAGYGVEQTKPNCIGLEDLDEDDD